MTDEMLKKRQVILANKPPPEEVLDEMFRTVASRVRDATAESYHGRLVCKQVVGRNGNIQCHWGTVKFRGKEFRPRYFEID